MIGKTNVAGGRNFACIGVTYPEGSICRCSNGTMMMKARTLSGRHVFVLPCKGDWTVSCYNGADYESAPDKKSQLVSITEEGQFESLHLAYRTEGYLYNAGVFNEEYQREEIKNNKCSITYNESDIYFKSSADSTAYGFVVFKDVIFDGQSAITVNRKSTSAGKAKNGVTIAVMEDSANWTPTKTAEGTIAYFYDGTEDVEVEGPVDRSLDVSAITPGVYDVAVGFSTQGSGWTGSRNIYMNYIKIE